MAELQIDRLDSRGRGVAMFGDMPMVCLVHQRGYTLTKAGVVDMFPQTRHIEAIAVFQRT